MIKQPYCLMYWGGVPGQTRRTRQGYITAAVVIDENTTGVMVNSLTSNGYVGASRFYSMNEIIKTWPEPPTKEEVKDAKANH